MTTRFRGISRGAVGVSLVVLAVFAACARAQSPAVAPREGYMLHDERAVGVFTVQRWVNSASQEVSPAGMCDCLTVVYLGSRRIATLGAPEVISATFVVEPSGRDINGDGTPDLVTSDWSGGAHCCYTTSVTSASDPPRTLLQLSTGNCGPGEFEDLDGDGVVEFTTCDDSWAYEYCSFADSPFPGVVFSYDRERGEYRAATPRYAGRFEREIAEMVDRARTHLAENAGKDLGVDKCEALRPALALMYIGRFDEGIRTLRELYQGADESTLEQAAVTRVRQSPLWAPP